MKTRLGFVSNSSSSSFVMFASERVFNEALKECTDMQREAVENYIEDAGEFSGVKLNKFSYYHSSEEYDDEIIDLVENHYPDKDEDDYSEVENLTDFVFDGGFDSLIEEKAKELNEQVLSHCENC